MRPIMRWTSAILLAACTWFDGALANPYTPIDDSVVLQRLPEKLDPTLAELKRMRAALRVDPANLDTAARVARRSIEAARATGDPRFLGQAQAALSPWWNAADPPAAALLLRATVKQSQHDFQGAVADLDRVLAKRPADGQALLTRATIATVQGRYAEAVGDCAKLSRVASRLVTTVCMASASSLNGNAPGAYRSLAQALAWPDESVDVRAWALTLAAEIAARRGDAAAADLHFHSALMLDPRDAYLLGAYADFLLEQGRARDVLPLLADRTTSDSLLLRVVLAEKALREAAVDLPAHQRELADRFAAAARRGDALHLREEARFRLEIENDAAAALALATANWKVQREPADLRILAAAARASGDAAAMSAVSQWIATTRIEDVALVPLDGALAGGQAR